MRDLIDKIINAAAKLDPNTHRNNGCVRLEIRHTEGRGDVSQVVAIIGRTDNDATNGKAEGATEMEALNSLHRELEVKLEARRQDLRTQLAKLE